MKKITFKILNFIGGLLIICQILSWVGIGLYKNGREHPMSKIGNFIVDDFGNIIIEESFYSVIQIYDKNGKFIISWERNDRNCELFLGKENTIIVKGSQTRYYQLNGKEIKDKTFEVSENNDFNRKNYTLTGGMFSPEIIKTENNKEKVIVKQSLLMNLTKAPFPFFGIGVILFFIIALQGTIEKLKEQPTAEHKTN